ncbi:hypothetical protein J7K41_00615 [Candidatus Micrarchaeota archaeon]|nr:hypothetical protein [Candidatus Micrarchaeota archaeon]
MSFALLIRDKRIIFLISVFVLAVGVLVFHGVRLGIDFRGGTRIPVLLEHPVDPDTMMEVINIIKVRANSFGLTEVKVYARGNDEVVVEIPSSDRELVEQTKETLEKQGKFIGVVDGKVALKGEDIFPGTIVYISPSQMHLGTGGWAVGFTINEEGAQRFAKVAYGKADYPVYMFLDRPSDAALFIYRDQLLDNSNLSIEEAITLANDALRLEGDDIQLYILDDFDGYKDDLQPKDNATTAIVPENAPDDVKEFLRSKGFNVVEKPVDEITPKYALGGTFNTIEEWPAVGLVSAPRLKKGMTLGTPVYSPVITGYGRGKTVDEILKNAEYERKRIASVLKGGSLPVRISLGSETRIPAPLGQKFLEWSILGGIIAVLAVASVVALRYRNLKLVLPILLTSIADVTILVAAVGLFTIDLGAFAGIIASIGVSVDAQVVITDELMKKGHYSVKKKLENAFSIVNMSAGVTILAMLPLLLFSGLPEVIGFATSTILGSLLGVLISRPAYAAFVEHFVLGEEEH